jgi:hypothetical protein
LQHGFLRSDDGTFTTFNGPGSIFTFPASINPAGAITGSPTIGGDVIIMRRAPP